MEQQFELHSTPNYRIIVENARKYGVGPRIPTVIITFLIMIFLVIYAEQMGFLGKIWHIIAIVAGIDLILFFLPHAFTLYGFSVLKKQNNGTLPEAIITVSDKIICRSGTEEIVYEWADLVGAVRLRYSYKLQFTKRRALLLDPGAFTKGNFEEFKRFIQEKRPDLLIPQ